MKRTNHLPESSNHVTHLKLKFQNAMPNVLIMFRYLGGVTGAIYEA